MDRNHLNRFIKGWFIGDFDPSLHKTTAFEVAVKSYEKGDYEDRHHHKIATEYTIIIKGKVKMNSIVYSSGDIITIYPGESTDFRVLEETSTLVVKIPSAKNDKYLD